MSDNLAIHGHLLLQTAIPSAAASLALVRSARLPLDKTLKLHNVEVNCAHKAEAPTKLQPQENIYNLHAHTLTFDNMSNRCKQTCVVLSPAEPEPACLGCGHLLKVCVQTQCTQTLRKNLVIN